MQVMELDTVTISLLMELQQEILFQDFQNLLETSRKGWILDGAEI